MIMMMMMIMMTMMMMTMMMMTMMMMILAYEAQEGEDERMYQMMRKERYGTQCAQQACTSCEIADCRPVQVAKLRTAFRRLRAKCSGEYL
jgi:hypothetical protein